MERKKRIIQGSEIPIKDLIIHASEPWVRSIQGHQNKTGIIRDTSLGTGLPSQEKHPRDLRTETFIVTDDHT